MSLTADDRKILGTMFGGRVRFDEPLSGHTSIRIGGPAAALVEPEGIDELTGLMRLVADRGIDWLILGGGTNLLVGDRGFDGVAITLAKGFGKIREETDAFITAEGGVRLSALRRYCTENGLSGLEFAAGIPGTVGGAAMMNAGAAGGDMGSVISAMSLLFPPDRVMTFERADLSFSYRKFHWEKISSGNSMPPVILSVSLGLEKADGDLLEINEKDLLARRKATQPAGLSAGCVFRNPAHEKSAGELIDRAGLKGCNVGDAVVSEEHANFIINRGRASSADVRRLISIVRKRVFDTHGINLEPEIIILGEE